MYKRNGINRYTNFFNKYFLFSAIIGTIVAIFFRSFLTGAYIFAIILSLIQVWIGVKLLTGVHLDREEYFFMAWNRLRDAPEKYYIGKNAYKTGIVSILLSMGVISLCIFAYLNLGIKFLIIPGIFFILGLAFEFYIFAKD